MAVVAVCYAEDPAIEGVRNSRGSEQGQVAGRLKPRSRRALFCLCISLVHPTACAISFSPCLNQNNPRDGQRDRGCCACSVG